MYDEDDCRRLLDGQLVTNDRYQAEPTRWLWDGYLARGAVTVMTSQWKAGKTTLLTLLLAAMGKGGTLAGREVRPGSAVVVSEEATSLWRVRHQRVGLGDHVKIVSRPFTGQPDPKEWEQLVHRHCNSDGGFAPSLFVVDPLASFVPGDENHARAMQDLLKPLTIINDFGAAVLILHHPKKGTTAAGQAARGSGALAGAADILVEMHCLGRFDETDRRRRLVGYSRFEETPRGLDIELSADGCEYRMLPTRPEREFDGGWGVLYHVLNDADDKVTRAEMLANWPSDHRKPGSETLREWLERAEAAGRVLKEGTGRKCDPFKYWLPGQEKVWDEDPFLLPRVKTSDLLGIPDKRGKNR